jgi:hypothetical protein
MTAKSSRRIALRGREDEDGNSDESDGTVNHDDPPSESLANGTLRGRGGYNPRLGLRMRYFAARYPGSTDLKQRTVAATARRREAIWDLTHYREFGSLELRGAFPNDGACPLLRLFKRVPSIKRFPDERLDRCHQSRFD